MAEKNKQQGNIFPDLKNEALVEAMNALKENETPETQANFVNLAGKANYFTPVDLLDKDGKPIEGTGKMAIPADSKFNFKLIKNTEGEEYFLAFTDIEEFQKWSKSDQIRTIVVGFPHIASLTMSKSDVVRGFVINPMTQNLVFKQEVLAGLLQQAKDAKQAHEQAETQSEQNKEKSYQILFGKPKNIPDSVLESFRKTLKRYPEINAVYFLMMKESEKEHYLFVFDIEDTGEKGKKIADSFCASARLFLTKFPVIAVPLKSPIGEHAPEMTEPFYKKA